MSGQAVRVEVRAAASDIWVCLKILVDRSFQGRLVADLGNFRATEIGDRLAFGIFRSPPAYLEGLKFVLGTGEPPRLGEIWGGT